MPFLLFLNLPRRDVRIHRRRRILSSSTVQRHLISHSSVPFGLWLFYASVSNASHYEFEHKTLLDLTHDHDPAYLLTRAYDSERMHLKSNQSLHDWPHSRSAAEARGSLFGLHTLLYSLSDEVDQFVAVLYVARSVKSRYRAMARLLRERRGLS